MTKWKTRLQRADSRWHLWRTNMQTHIRSGIHALSHPKSPTNKPLVEMYLLNLENDCPLHQMRDIRAFVISHTEQTSSAARGKKNHGIYEITRAVVSQSDWWWGDEGGLNVLNHVLFSELDGGGGQDCVGMCDTSTNQMRAAGWWKIQAIVVNTARWPFSA